MKHYRLETALTVELDIEAAFEWYQEEEQGLGFEFLEELRTMGESKLRLACSIG